jgi:FMN phosphatase YigB (HAD superfamily)
MRSILKSLWHNDIYGIYGPPLPSVSTPETIICAFDLHKVIFHRSWPAIVSYIAHMPNKRKALTFLLNPFFWFRVFAIWRKTSVGDEIYDQLTLYYPGLALFKHDFINLENMQLPDESVAEILHALKARGFTLYVLSNIGKRAFVDLARKFPDLFALFDHAYLPCKELAYIQKPNLIFYRDFIRYKNRVGDGDKHILFIDDRIKNIRAAASLGITCIYFRCSAQLNQVLRARALL